MKRVDSVDRPSMRLRSSQFVFLLLLVCSVQTREVYALNLIAAASGRSSTSFANGEVNTATAPRERPSSLPVGPRQRQMRLEAASQAVHSTPWSVRRPAQDAAAVSSFTGFLRA